MRVSHQGVDSGDHSTVEPPVPIPNTEVKRSSAEGSATIGRVRVGRCQNYSFIPLGIKGKQNAHSALAEGHFFCRGVSIVSCMFRLNVFRL